MENRTEPTYENRKFAIMVPSFEGRALRGDTWYRVVKWITFTTEDSYELAIKTAANHLRSQIVVYHSQDWENLVERTDYL